MGSNLYMGSALDSQVVEPRVSIVSQSEESTLVSGRPYLEARLSDGRLLYVDFDATYAMTTLSISPDGYSEATPCTNEETGLPAEVVESLRNECMARGEEWLANEQREGDPEADRLFELGGGHS